MGAAEGILTSTGGMTSHAAVVARGWGKCCICGAGELKIDEKKGSISVGGKTYKEGAIISLNGSTGKVYSGEIPSESSPIVAALVEGNKAAQKHWIFKMYQTVSDWSDKFRKINVRTNADSPADSINARAFGAEGIGLCRTEHMFFEGDRITDVRKFILADTDADRNKAIKKLLPHQRKDFMGIFQSHERSASDSAFVGSTTSRISASHRSRHEEDGQGNERSIREGSGTRRRAARVQSNAGTPWLPSEHYFSGSVRDADTGDYRSGR